MHEEVAKIPSVDLQDRFVPACRAGNLLLVCELLSLSRDRFIDVHINEKHAFRVACWKGHIEVVCELLGLTGDRTVDVHAKEEEAFRQVCWKGHLDVMQHLLALTGDRLICLKSDALPPAGLAMLASGLGDPHSPTVAAAWRAISSPGA